MALCLSMGLVRVALPARAHAGSRVEPFFEEGVWLGDDCRSASSGDGSWLLDGFWLVDGSLTLNCSLSVRLSETVAFPVETVAFLSEMVAFLSEMVGVSGVLPFLSEMVDA